MSDSVTPDGLSGPVVHSYAGWCGKILCAGNNPTPDGSHSCTLAENVTCPACLALLPKQPARCPHGFDLRFVQCQRCADPAFDAARGFEIAKAAASAFTATTGEVPVRSSKPVSAEDVRRAVKLLHKHSVRMTKGEWLGISATLLAAAEALSTLRAEAEGHTLPDETKPEVKHLRDALVTVRKYLEGTSMATWIDGFFNGKPPKYSAEDYERVIAAGGNGWSTLERLREMAMENHGFQVKATGEPR